MVSGIKYITKYELQNLAELSPDKFFRSGSVATSKSMYDNMASKTGEPTREQKSVEQ